MRGTPSCSTTSACLPMARSTWQQASAEPTASPSGRACDVSTNLSCCPICRRTSSTPLCFFSTISLACLVSLLRSRQQLFHSRLFLLRTIQTEIQLGSSSQMQPLHQFVTAVLFRGFQALQALVRVLIAAFDIHPDFCGSSIVGDVNGGYTPQTNTPISPFPFSHTFH